MERERQKVGFAWPVERLYSRMRGKEREERGYKRKEWIVSVAPSLYPNHPSFTSLSASSFSALRTVVRPLQPEIATY